MRKHTGYNRIRGLLLAAALAWAALISFPAHSQSIFIGDSRTVGMYNAVYGGTDPAKADGRDPEGNLWIAKSGEGLSWLPQAFSKAEGEIRMGDTIYILLGVNDILERKTADQYAEAINNVAKHWTAKGANTYYVSLNPVSEPNEWGITNDMVRAWNETIRSMLSPKVTYIDTFHLLPEANLVDWGHYTEDTYREIYSLVARRAWEKKTDERTISSTDFADDRGETF